MIKAYLREQNGAAAVEFTLMLGLFTISLPSVVDLGVYAYDNMQVQNSAQMGAQAIWAACSQLPATDSGSCPTAQSALNAAVSRTALGTAVAVPSGGVTEGYYCAGSSGTLVNADTNGKTGDFTTSLTSAVPSPPTSCPSGSLTTSPGEYIKVNVSFSYSPVFANASVGRLLGTSIQGTAWMRLL
jgi:Flp pilus assembly protein TadG